MTRLKDSLIDSARSTSLSIVSFTVMLVIGGVFDKPESILIPSHHLWGSVSCVWLILSAKNRCLAFLQSFITLLRYTLYFCESFFTQACWRFLMVSLIEGSDPRFVIGMSQSDPRFVIVSAVVLRHELSNVLVGETKLLSVVLVFVGPPEVFVDLHHAFAGVLIHLHALNVDAESVDEESPEVVQKPRLRVAVCEVERQRKGVRNDALASVQRGDGHGVYVLGSRFGLDERRDLHAPFPFDRRLGRLFETGFQLFFSLHIYLFL